MRVKEEEKKRGEINEQVRNIKKEELSFLLRRMTCQRTKIEIL